MRIGIIALVAVFIASGIKNLQDADIGHKREASESDRVYNRRKLGFGILLLIVGVLVLLYYVVTL